MKTVIFIHGTGVRKESYEQSFTQVQDELTQRQSGLSVLPCYWGNLGTQLNAKGASIPDYDSTRRISNQPVTDDDYLISLWELLYRDPLYELRLLSLRTGESVEVLPKQRPPGEQLKKSVDEFPLVSEMDGALFDLREKLTQGGIASVFDEARQDIIDASPFHQAIHSASKGLDEYRIATARAIVAQAIVKHATEDILPIIANVPADERLPAHFPTWFNVYDRRDFLSYIGTDIFGSKVGSPYQPMPVLKINNL